MKSLQKLEDALPAIRAGDTVELSFPLALELSNLEAYAKALKKAKGAS